jgi:hypothetical protein
MTFDQKEELVMRISGIKEALDDSQCRGSKLQSCLLWAKNRKEARTAEVQ